MSWLLAAALLVSPKAWASEPSDSATDQTDQTVVTAAPPAPEVQAMDVGDLWRLARHRSILSPERPASSVADKPFIVAAPSIGSKPSTGLTLGMSGNMAFFKGDPATTHISSVTGGVRLSQEHQTLSGVRFAVFTDEDRWFIQGDNRFSWTSQNTYGFGTSTSAADATNVKYDFFRLYETVYRRTAPHLFVGFGLNVDDHANIRPNGGVPIDQSAYAEYDEKHGFSASGQTSSGTSVNLLFDTRDNGINPQRGWLASSTFRTFYDGFLGGDSSWQELYVDVRTYRKLTKQGPRKLAFWFLGDVVTGGTAPYLDLPSTGADGRSARGYGEGRYRGERLVYGEMEYRDSLTKNGLVGVVGFLNVTTVDSEETGERLFDAYAPGAGFGFRFLLNKKSKTNLCTDYGWGKDGSRGFYLAIQEAF